MVWATSVRPLHQVPKASSQKQSCHSMKSEAAWSLWAAKFRLYQLHTNTHSHTQDYFIKCQPCWKADSSFTQEPQARLRPESITDTSITSLQNNLRDILKVTNATLIWTTANMSVDICIIRPASVLLSPGISVTNASQHWIKGLWSDTAQWFRKKQNLSLRKFT